MPRFEFATATRIVFGAGTLRDLGTFAADMGKCALVVTNRTGGSDTLLDSLESHGVSPLEILHEKHIETTVFAVASEPTVDILKEGMRSARETGCTLIIGIGGGSAMDTAKAISSLLANGGDPLDYLEVIGKGKPLTQPSLPWIAIPTTAGTGAEVTANAVIESPEHRVKVSLRSPLMLARLALVDPELTYYLPPGVTASTGLDALTQVIEPFVSNKANPLTDALCREGIRRAARSLQRVYEGSVHHLPPDAVGREDMAITSLFGGLALANAKLGTVHGFAGPLGGFAHAPHGAICACLLPHVGAVNVRALLAREPDNPAIQRYDEIAQMLTGDPQAAAVDGVAWIKELTRILQIPSLSALGVSRADFPLLIEKTAVTSSTKGNPIVLTQDELAEILDKAY